MTGPDWLACPCGEMVSDTTFDSWHVLSKAQGVGLLFMHPFLRDLAYWNLWYNDSVGWAIESVP